MSALKDLRTAAGYPTRKDASNLFGVAENTVYRWESGRTPVPDYVPRMLELVIKTNQLEAQLGSVPDHNEWLRTRQGVMGTDFDGALRRAFRIVREAKGLDEEQLGRLANVSRSWLIHFELHDSRPSPELLSKALDGLGVDPFQVFRTAPRLQKALRQLDAQALRIIIAILILSGSVVAPPSRRRQRRAPRRADARQLPLDEPSA